MMLSTLKLWFIAARPKTLPVSICPIIIGLVEAHSNNNFSNLTAALTLSAACLIQIGTNFANDYFDHKKGGDTKDRVGPTRILTTKKVSLNQVKWVMITSFVLAFILGIGLIIKGGWVILAIGLASILFGILYTASPFSLAYLGIADIFVFIFFGPISVLGTYYLQTLQWNSQLLPTSMSIGLLSTAILAVNNTRDVKEDKKTGKKTIVVRFGEKFGKIEYATCLIISFILLSQETWQASWTNAPLFLIAICIFHLIKKMITRSDKQLNPLLGQTGILLILFSIVFII